MNYQNTLTYLYNSVPMFQHVGGAAYKEGLENTQVLDRHFGHPHRSFRTIHVAGTNGKGSCSHTLAAILQEAGYRVGLYTSPHLVDFRERIRINGQPIPEKYVVDFVEKERDFFEPLHPSFFELTTAMAFRYFADEKVDVAVIEVGLGGRLDCTNIIHPDLCIITNISFDHVQFLGDTLAKIAGEKAGIIKAGIPVVIGETTPETKPVFLQKAAEEKAPIIFAEDTMKNDYPKMKTELQGLYQIKNTRAAGAELPPDALCQLPAALRFIPGQFFLIQLHADTPIRAFFHAVMFPVHFSQTDIVYQILRRLRRFFQNFSEIASQRNSSASQPNSPPLRVVLVRICAPV